MLLARALALQFFHPFLNSRLRVDESLARITHSAPRRIKSLNPHYKMTRVRERRSAWRRFIRPCARGLRRPSRRPPRPQALGWPAIARGESTLILAPTGSGKTLAAFLWCLDRLMFAPRAAESGALPRAVRVAAQGARGRRRAQPARAARRHRADRATARGDAVHHAGDRDPHRRHAAAERARFQREPADILITTPESLYLLLTSNAREALRSVDTIIIDEIHALVPTKRGAHLALSHRAARGALRRRRRSASACRRRSGRSTRWRGFSAASQPSRPSAGRAAARPRTASARHEPTDDDRRTSSPSHARRRPLPPGHDRRRRRRRRR